MSRSLVDSQSVVRAVGSPCGEGASVTASSWGCCVSAFTAHRYQGYSLTLLQWPNKCAEHAQGSLRKPTPSADSFRLASLLRMIHRRPGLYRRIN